MRALVLRAQFVIEVVTAVFCDRGRSCGSAKHLLRHRLVVGEDRAAFAGTEVLAELEAEAAGGAPTAHAAIAPLGQVGLAGVLDHRHVVFLGDGEDAVQVGDGAADVDGDDRRGAVGDRRLELGRIHQERFAIGSRRRPAWRSAAGRR